MKILIRLALALALVFMATSPPSAQSIGNPQTITVIDSGTACTTVTGSCATFPVLGSNAVAFDVSGTWTGTLTFEGDASGGGIWRTILMTNTADGTTATTTTANGTFAVGNAGFYSVRVRATAAVTGTAFVTATKGNLSAKLLTPSFSTATADVFCLNRSGQDLYIGRVAANDIGLYTGATLCASGTLRFDVSATGATASGTIAAGNGKATFAGSQDKLIQVTGTTTTIGIEFNVGTPTLGTCTGGSLVSGAKNTLFEVTGNTSGSCVVNFGTPIWQNAPLCFINDETALIAVRISARSTNAITVTGAGSGDAFQVYCLGRVGT